MPSLQGIQGFLKQYSSDKKIMNERMENFDTKLTDLQETIDSKIEESVEKSFKNFREREEKKCNLKIHNLQELGSADKEAQFDHDESQLRCLLDVLGAGEVQVKSHIRLGKRENTSNESTGVRKPRLILLSVDNVFNKQKILKGTKNLRIKDEDDEYVHLEFSNVFISNDMTKQERAARFNLRKELKSRKDNGESDLVIYGGKIMSKAKIAKNKGGGRSSGEGDPAAFRG